MVSRDRGFQDPEMKSEQILYTTKPVSTSTHTHRKSWRMTSWNLTVVVLTWLVLISWLSSPTLASQYDFIHCDEKCDESLCPELTYCEGVPIKDSCNCCMICSDDKYQPHARALSVPPSGGEACKQVQCPKFKICSENMQGLPLCKCPSTFFCRKKKKREICATNGITYPSRCHMRIASCNLGSAVRKKYRGPCSPEKDRKLRRRRLRMERRRLRGETEKNRRVSGKDPSKKKSSGGKNGKDRVKRKRKNRKRRKIHNRRSRGKRRTRRHRRINHHDAQASRAFEEAFAHYTWSK